MKGFNAAAGAVKHGGVGPRRKYGNIENRSSDILDFIIYKDEDDGLNSSNIFIVVTKKFMNALKKENIVIFIIRETGREKRCKKVYIFSYKCGRYLY